MTDLGGLVVAYALAAGSFATGSISGGPLWVEGTPLKFNIAPKNRQSQKETHPPTIIFQGLC